MAMGKGKSCCWWSGAEQMAVICHSSLMPDLVAKAILCLGHKKFKSYPGRAVREEEGRHLCYTTPQGVVGERCPQICPSTPWYRWAIDTQEPCLHYTEQCGRRKTVKRPSDHHASYRPALKGMTHTGHGQHFQPYHVMWKEDVTQGPTRDPPAT